MNEVTAYGIFKVLRETDANALSAKAIAIAGNIDTTSENLQQITDQLFDSGNEYMEISGSKTRFWMAI